MSSKARADVSCCHRRPHSNFVHVASSYYEQKKTAPLTFCPFLTMSVVGYCRVSTTMQAQDGISLETQRQKIESWAEYNEKPIRRIYVDEGISGKTKEGRPQLQLALAALQVHQRRTLSWCMTCHVLRETLVTH